MSNPLHIKATQLTPLVHYNESTRTLLFEGESRPENVKKFYDPIIAWMTEYLATEPAQSVVNVDLKFEYLNSASIKYIYDILMVFEKQVAKHKITVTWYYVPEDDLMLENGEDYSNLVPNLNIQIKQF
ncbi:MAG: DUF1987 domain-containing protein [Bacteroidia bacterium]|nr:DUF1987 domain-containing protein [Bacteroidia bacterium]